MAKKKDIKAQSPELSTPPSGLRIIFREILHDKIALVALSIIVLILLVTMIGSFFYNYASITEVNIMDSYYGYFTNGHIFGTDEGGRDILAQVIVGGRNSILIGVSVTAVTMGIGLVLGLIVGYYGGLVDAIVMRIVDFIQILPQMPILIVLVAVIPNYNAFALVGIISMFGWTGNTRYYRSFVLSQRGRDYVMASKTSGSSDLKIMFKEVLPNISSMIIIDLVLSVAGNIGIETSLSFLGYGLPPQTPSLGTLISYANDPANIIARPWLWMPATILLLVISLSINYVGRALQRAGDARQRQA